MPSGRSETAEACRILARWGLDSTPFGNVSVRIGGKSESWQNPSGMAFHRITPEDVLRVDHTGHVLEGVGEPHPGEFIHREIYRLRPDVGAIVHTHTFHTVMLSLLGVEIEPFTQLGASFFGDQGVYRGFSGPVRTSEEGRLIAEALGNNTLVIAKNHGVFAVGPHIRAALWNMVVADQAARIQVSARQLGLNKADSLPEEDLSKSRREVRERQWDIMWKNGLMDMENGS